MPWVEDVDNFAALKSLDWQIHIYGAATAEIREFAASVGLPHHELPWTADGRRAGLTRDALYLVRPDGHIGFARRRHDVVELRAYLAGFGYTVGPDD